MLKASTEGVYFSLLRAPNAWNAMRCFIYTLRRRKPSAVEFNNALSLSSLLFMLLFLLIILFMTKDMMKYSAITSRKIYVQFEAEVLLTASQERHEDRMKCERTYLEFTSYLNCSHLLWMWTTSSSKSEHQK